MPKIHLAKGAGGRSMCRYTARPGREAPLLPLARFVLLPRITQCSECLAKAAALQKAVATPRRTEVFHLDEGQEVHCYYCLRANKQTVYKRGEAFLADAGHSPCDGNANFICRAHLEDDAVIDEPAAMAP
jgi:hypothetical protein